jgi:hypothetical protein
MKNSNTKSTRAARKRLALQQETVRALSAGLPQVVGGNQVGTGGGGGNSACTGNETGCMASNVCPA